MGNPFDAAATLNRKKGPIWAPESCWLMDLFVGSVVVVGRQNDESTVDRKRLQFDAEAWTFFVGKAAPILVQRF